MNATTLLNMFELTRVGKSDHNRVLINPLHIAAIVDGTFAKPNGTAVVTTAGLEYDVVESYDEIKARIAALADAASK